VGESKALLRLGPIGRFAVVLGVLGLVGCAQTGVGGRSPDHPQASMKTQPWEWWRDLATVASIPVGDRTVMRSSHCPSGCRFDRHSEGDSRFLRVREDGEGVIFSADGAGAVTRIWMVMGDGISQPLDRSIRLRVRIDGRPSPVVDLPLPALFDGTEAPFVPPLVADREVSGGGNVSYVPIAFRDGCEISLVGADRSKIWFQVTAHLVDDPTGIRSFSGKESFDGLRAVLGRAGKDPWQGSPSPTISGSAVLTPGDSKLIATFEGPDLINGILIRAHRSNWNRLGLRLTFDDREPQLIPLLDLMGVSRPDGGTTRSLLMGADADGDLYCYFPMPFFHRATVELMRRPIEGPSRFRVEYAVRTAGTPPPDDAGIFHVQVRSRTQDSSDQELTLMEADGGGKWVGLVADVRRFRDLSWAILEGDERVTVNGETDPFWLGTGTEDLFNGGFYFRNPQGHPTPFTTALAGAPFLLEKPVAAVMYRLLLGDAVVFNEGIRADLEIGPTGGMSVLGRTVAFFYSAREDDEESAGSADG